MSKIVIDAREYSTSTGRYVYRLVQYLEKIDTTNHYVILLKPHDMATADFSNPRFTKLVCPHKEFSFAEQLGFAWQLYRLQPDLVHFSVTNQPILYARRKVTTVHDLTTLRFYNPDKQRQLFWLKQQVLKLVLLLAAYSSRQIITPTQFVAQAVIGYTHIKPAKVTVTYEAGDPTGDAPQAVSSLVGKQFIMYVGRPTPHKNLGRLIEAFKLLQAKYPSLQLVLAGKLDANYRRIRQLTKDEQITNIIFTDFVSEGQLRWLYEHCTAYVFPSLSEGFGLPPLEAMLHGAPVVSSNATCLPEVYGDAAHYFDPLDVPAMAKAINDVLTDDRLRQALIAAGRHQAAKYSWRRMAEQTLAVYQQALR